MWRRPSPPLAPRLDDVGFYAGSNLVHGIASEVLKGDDGKARGVCVKSVVAMWYCGCLTMLVDIEIRNIQRNRGCWNKNHTLDFENGRCATEISTAIRLSGSLWHPWM